MTDVEKARTRVRGLLREMAAVPAHSPRADELRQAVLKAGIELARLREAAKSGVRAVGPASRNC